MTKPYISIFCFLILLCCVSISNAASIVDTVVYKKTLKANSLGYQMGDYITYFKEALSYIQKNDIDKGTQLFATGIKHIYAEKKVDRTLPYQTHEIFSLILEASEGKVSKDEKRLTNALIIGVFGKNKPSEKTMRSYMKEANNSLFTKRFRLLFASLVSDTTINEQVDKMLYVKPNLVSANILKAEILLGEHSYDDCIKYCDKVIELSPTYAYAYKLKGDCLAGLNKYEPAINIYTKAIDLFPQYYEAIYQKSTALVDNDEYKAAIPGLRVINNLSPSYKWSAYNLARSYRRTNMPDSALHYINMHIKQNPDDGDGYDIKGEIYYYQADQKTAIGFFNQAIQLDSLKAYYYEDRGDAHFYNDSINYALKDFKKSVSLDTSSAYSYRRIGDCYYVNKDYEQAIVYNKKAIEVRPDNKYAYVSLNMCYEKLNKFEEAVEASKKAIAIDSTYQTALGNLGWTYYRMGNNKLSIEYSYKALGYDNSATYAMFNIALATLRQGDFEKAKTLYRNFIKECKKHDYKINDGAIVDLNDLIAQKILVKESRYIINNIFQEK